MSKTSKKNTNANRNRIGFVLKDGYPICGKGGYSAHGVSGNTVKILALPQARAWAKRVGGVAHEITQIVSKEDGTGIVCDSYVGEDWGTK